MLVNTAASTLSGAMAAGGAAALLPAWSGYRLSVAAALRE